MSYEIAYLTRKNDIRSKLYENQNVFLQDLGRFASSGLPTMAQWMNKETGKNEKMEINGWNDDDVILTAVVTFSSGKKYSYSAGRHYIGKYEIETKFGKSIVDVTYEWRVLDDFRAEMFEKGYDYPTSFESVKVRKIK